MFDRKDPIEITLPLIQDTELVILELNNLYSDIKPVDMNCLLIVYLLSII